MGHTTQQLIDAGNAHGKLTRFLDAAHTGTADVVVGAKANGRGRAQEHSVPREVAQPIIDHAVEEARKLEVEYGIEPWRAPKGVAGKAVKKDGEK
jgi:hypothetical protein